MIIDESSKVIFLHNPKCGGSFFRNLCSQNGLKTSEIYWDYHSEETDADLAYISLINLPRFVPDYQEYKIIAFVRNPYNRFASGIKEVKIAPGNAELKKVLELCGNDIKKFCSHLLNLSYHEQDQILRNPAIPWLMPQSCFTDKTTITLRYESLVDWQFLFNVFNIPEANVRIGEDYALDDETKRMIRELYFEDEDIFCLYDKNKLSL